LKGNVQIYTSQEYKLYVFTTYSSVAGIFVFFYSLAKFVISLMPQAVNVEDTIFM